VRFASPCKAGRAAAGFRAPLAPLPPLAASAPLATLALLVLLVGSGCGAAPRAAAHAPPAAPPLPRGNILLITVDTLRADHLSSYGYPRRTTPTLDRLAAEGVRFDQTAVQWPKTTPSFASLFTATYSKDNEVVRRVGIPVSCRFEMLAEVLKRQGYATAAVVANGALGREFNFNQGFDTYVETWKLTSLPAGGDPTRAEVVTTLAEGLLDGLQRGKKPYFLWVHYLDPHFPYSSPPAWRDRFRGDRFYDPRRKLFVSPNRPQLQMGGIGRDQVIEGHEDLAFYVARYDAAIAYADDQIGVLLGEMKRRGLLSHTLTVFTADHGESLGEHDYFFDHGRFSFQTCLRVPLIFHYPGVLAPRVERQVAELIDVAPTLIESAGVNLPGGAWKQGRSLTPRLRGLAPAVGAGAPGAARGGRLGRRPPGAAAAAVRERRAGLAFSEAGWETNNKWQKIVRDGNYKLIFAQTNPEQRWIGGPGVRFTLYDLASDPGETTNAADRLPAVLERLKRELWAWEHAPHFEVETKPESMACKPRPGQQPMEPATRALLHSLGYL
jgi:arylsulfatase A-like enzyme